MTDKATELFDSIESIASQPTERKNPVQQETSSAPSQFFDDKPIVEVKPEAPAGAPKKLTEEEIKAAGKTGAFMYGSTIELAFSLMERVVYINRFTAEEKAQMLSMDTKNPTASDENLNRKFLAINTKHDKIREKIDLSKREMEALEFACAEKARITGEAMDPKVILYTTIAKVFLSRSMDIFL